MGKILVVDDEAKIRLIIRKYGEFDGHEIFEAKDGMEALGFVKNQDVDLVIMDVMMPELDGFTACQEIKKIKNIPVIMLSARTDEFDRIHGFEVGADDYVIKPFSPKELMMRVGVALKRSGQVQQFEGSMDVYTYNGLEVNFTAHTVAIDGNRIELSPKEYDLLFYFVKNRGIALTRERLLNEVWGYDYYGDDRTLDTHVKLLRNSLDVYRKLLVTVRGVGYRFEGE